MPSIIPGYEYDIFISYRQKDNQSDQWVTKTGNQYSHVKENSKDADYIFSICTGAFILAEIGILDNLEATTHGAGIDILKRNYPTIKKVRSDTRFVDNGKVITSDWGFSRD